MHVINELVFNCNFPSVNIIDLDFTGKEASVTCFLFIAIRYIT